MKTDLTDVDITKELLEISEEVGDGEKDKQRRAEEIEDEGLRVERLQQQLSKVEAMVSELESGVENDTKTIEKVRERVSEREDEDEFQKNFDRDTIDAKDYKRLKRVLEKYESTVSRLAIERQVLLATYFQLKDLVDHQQMVNDEDRIVSAVKDIQENLEDIYEKNLNSTTEIFEKKMEGIHSNMEELQEEMNSVKKTQAKRDQQLTDAIQNLSNAIQNMPQGQRNPDRGGQRNSSRPRNNNTPSNSSPSQGGTTTSQKEPAQSEPEPSEDAQKYVEPDTVTDIASYIENAQEHFEEVEGTFNYEHESILRFLHNNPVNDYDNVEGAITKFYDGYDTDEVEPVTDRFGDKTIAPNRVRLAIGNLKSADILDEETYNFNSEV